MKKFLRIATAAALAATAGCMTVQRVDDFADLKVCGGRTPSAAIEVTNSVWLLFNFIPIASGNPDAPNANSCRWFRNTVNLENNMSVVKRIADADNGGDISELTSRYADEKYLLFLLARRSCHTSAVLTKRAPKGPAR